MVFHPFVFLEKSSWKASKSGRCRERRRTGPVPGYQATDNRSHLCSHTRDYQGTLGRKHWFHIAPFWKPFAAWTRMHLTCGQSGQWEARIICWTLGVQSFLRCQWPGMWQAPERTEQATQDGFPKEGTLAPTGLAVKSSWMRQSKPQGIYLHVWNALKPRGKVYKTIAMNINSPLWFRKHFFHALSQIQQ